MPKDIYTLETARKRTYGLGLARSQYVEGKCVAEVWAHHASWQCTRKNGHGPGGLYCYQHDPVRRQKVRAEARAAEQRQRDIRLAEKQRREQIERVQRAAVDALKKSPCGVLLLQGVDVRDAKVSQNCEPCCCWRGCLDNLPLDNHKNEDYNEHDEQLSP